jgi:pimeloyl-ACP methyl ester carboxylesterase
VRADGLLLVHAFPLDARMWEGQATYLRALVPVVNVDLPGFGGTPGAGRVMSMAAAAERCLEQLDAAGLETAVVCGLSMGGYVAFELWRRARTRVAGLVLANTRAEADAPEGVEGRRALAARLLREGNAFLAQDPPPLLSDRAPDHLRVTVSGWIADQPAVSIAAAAMGMAERPDSTPDLAGIDVPTLVITSTADALIPPDVTTAMAERIPEADLALIEGAGHLSNLEAPEVFGELLEAHVGRCGVL